MNDPVEDLIKAWDLDPVLANEVRDLAADAYREGREDGEGEAYDEYERENQLAALRADDDAYWLEYDRERGAIA